MLNVERERLKEMIFEHVLDFDTIELYVLC